MGDWVIVRRRGHSLIIQYNTVVSRSDMFIFTSSRREITLHVVGGTYRHSAYFIMANGIHFGS